MYLLLPLAIDCFMKNSIQNSIVEMALAIDQAQSRLSRKTKHGQVT